jgi:transposase-like protein
MRQRHESKLDSAEKAVRDIRRATRQQYFAEEKNRIVLEGIRGEDSIAERCRREGINQICTTVGRRSSWRRVRSVWPVIRRVRRAVRK